MTRRVVITGVGPVSGLGIGIDANWEAALAGRCAVGPIQAFDASGFDCQIGSEVPDFKIGQFVPKYYRKATKVMARDIELAVAAADQAARDAGLTTPGTDPSGGKDESYQPSYPPSRVGCHIGADLIAADADELTAALAEAGTTDGDPEGPFDMHKWGEEGQNHLTPLWLLKYLPNMLACHVTITHDAQGPSNTITCNEASSGLSIGESLRVIQRNKADICFCGGGSSKVNLSAYMRQEMIGRLTNQSNENPAQAVRPFDQQASGTVVGEGAGIVIIESLETAQNRADAKIYAEIVGSASTQTYNPDKRNIEPDEQGKGIASAIRRAMQEANIEPNDIDLILPFGCGMPAWDLAERNAMQAVLGEALANIPVLTLKTLYGNSGAAAGGLDICIAAKAIYEQTLPPIVNRDQPIEGMNNQPTEATAAQINHVLVFSTGLGGQNQALVLKRFVA